MACHHVWRRRVPLVLSRTVIWRCHECRARARLSRRLFKSRRPHLRLVERTPR